MPTPPSFSSFPPSFGSFPDLEAGTSKEKKSETKQGSSKKESKGKREKGKRPIKRSEWSNSNHKEASSREHKDGDASKDTAKDLFLDDERLKAEEDSRRKTKQHDRTKLSFYTDKKGDPLNVQYGSIYSRDVPKYHMVARGRKILGLTPGWSVAYRSNRGVELSEGGSRKALGIEDPRTRHILETTPIHRLVASTITARKYQEVDGVIPLPSRKHRIIQGDDYRSIDPSKERDSEDDSSSSSEASSDDDDNDNEGISLPSHQEKTKSLEERLDRDPLSVSTWLAVLSHSLSQVPSSSKNVTKVRSEITLSVLDRALSKLPKGPSSTRIQIMYLQAAEDVWTNDRLQQEWEEALSSGVFDLSMAWLDWRIRAGIEGLDGTLEAVSRVFATASSEVEKLRVFWRLACVLRQAGFDERSMALFQAQADLAGFHNPPAISGLPLEERLDRIEEFWDSEAPRIGEPGSTGWAGWHAAGKPESEIAMAPATAGGVAISAQDRDPYRRWSQDETRKDEALRPALRSTDTEADSDPYATILFSDLRPFLFAQVSSRSKGLLRLMWLSFLGLHVPGLEPVVGSSDDDRWASLHLVSRSYLDALFPSPTDSQNVAADSHAGVLVGKEKQYADSFGPVKNWSYRSLGPLEAAEFRNGMARWGMWTKEDLSGVDVGFVRRLFEQCRMDSEDVEWDLLALAFEAVVDVKSALKKSRGFLASAPESLTHWTAHARLERLRGRLDEARKVYQTVLSSPASTRSRLSVGSLWWEWAEMEWLAGQSDAAIKVALQAAEVEGSGGLAILRGKRALEATAREIPEAFWKAREAWVRLGALLELLTGSSLPSFLTDPLEAGSVTQESMAVASLGMLYHHISTLRSPMRPSVLRERLEKAIELFPNNTAILGMFLEMQKGQGLWGRVRGLGDADTFSLDDVTRERGVSRRVVELWLGGWEQGRWSWEIERIRSGLVTAAESGRTRGSPILWRLLLELEIRAGDLARAKNVLLRAIGECPLVKDMYMQAFDRLRPVFSAQELKNLWEAMIERGLRMRQGLEDVVERWGEVERAKSESEDEALDEIEYNARELARLKPY